MSNNIFVITEHLKGQVDDVSYEMLGKAKELAASYGGQVIAVLLGSGAKSLADDFAADKVLYAGHPQLAEFNPEGYCKTIAGLVNSHEPKAVLVAYSSQGVDIAAALSVECDLPLVAYVSNLNAESITSQLYGGKMSVESKVEGERYIAAVLPGAFPADAGKGGGATVEEVAVPELDGLKVRFKHLIEPEGGDVDITQQKVLVSVGRGIQNEDNLPIVQELADKLGGALSSSRPIVDSKWLPKTRQVGKSGLKVKPKVYIAVGISGAPEHIEGMKDAECIIAINTDPNAPIFDYAHYGVTEDLFDVVPALTEKL
ncbi:MAG: electron transfer flavoprotein subunit alpha/FixB family protein [Phaeodactylibacter sp.]|nr:electron transfer flavoprotein subunit alpha/FixB family protein [Phaeodactylibacter sp.]MCB9265833.1 electron transfer flavoprotein subunit alpha/FixB family protein [Lewinellaceae bacterium]MCB9288829.1 electron transfer flavoprotein subunit alpha/FixB family protein [Lewinellaceae bacterium]